VTFDDGFRSVFEQGFDVLSELGVPATVFVVTDFVGGRAPMSWDGIGHWVGGQDEAELVAMSWDELRQLSANGWEIGSHTCTHRRLTRSDDETLADELRSSRDRCEELLGRPCRSLAYPFGDVDDRVIDAVREAGFAAACTLPDRWHRPMPLAWPRVGAWQTDGRIRSRIKVSRPFRQLRNSPLWTSLAISRRALQATSGLARRLR
jgi:peptidoglycan/xylan/chitin deacetylase (PgdA/CDA1 family)